jgi:hypothetical protein
MDYNSILYEQPSAAEVEKKKKRKRKKTDGMRIIDHDEGLGGIALGDVFIS